MIDLNAEREKLKAARWELRITQSEKRKRDLKKFIRRTESDIREAEMWLSKR